MSKNVIITQSNFIPWKGYFDGINIADEFIIYDDMQYTKRDWRNRNKIVTPQGLKWLSVPVEVKGKYFQKINETKISEADWGKKHWNQIQQNYKKAPFYKETAEVFQPLFESPQSDLLSEVNQKFIQVINAQLGITTKIRRSEEFELAEGKTERLVEICKEVGATDYYSGPAAQNYMEESLFEAAGIKVHYFDYSGYPEYVQQHGDFEHGVTILDLFFNVGLEAAKNYLKSFKDAPVDC